MSTIAVTNLKHESASGNNITLDSSGNVGVGVSTPGYSIDALSSGSVVAQFKRNATGGGSGGIRFGNNDKQFTLYADSSNGMTVYDGVTERMRIDSSGNLQFNSGYGSVATGFGVRAWVKLNQSPSPDTISGSGNVSSLTDIGTGRTQINFANAMPDSNYAAVSGLDNNINQWWIQSYTTGSCLVAMYTGSAYTDQNNICVLIVR